LQGCRSEACEVQRNKLHEHAFNELASGEVGPETIEKLWEHGKPTTSPACLAEKIILPHLRDTAQARAELIGQLGSLLTANLETAIDETYASAGNRAGYQPNAQAQALAEHLAELSSGMTIRRAVELGKRAGTAAGLQVGPDRHQACAGVEKQWEGAEDILSRARMGEGTILNSIKARANQSPLGMASVALSGKAYDERLHQLYEASAAKALLMALDEKCKSGCAAD